MQNSPMLREDQYTLRAQHTFSLLNPPKENDESGGYSSDGGMCFMHKNKKTPATVTAEMTDG